MNISGVVITKNEAANIAGCLKSLDWCHEILVIDSFSIDDTAIIAESCGARVVKHEFENYGAQKQFAVEQCACDWILMIDADERVTSDLQIEIMTKIDEFPESVSGARIPMLDMMFGKYIHYGGWGYYYRTSLYRKNHVRFESVVHEHAKVTGSVEKLDNVLLHFSHFSIDHFLFKLNKYTALEAKTAFDAGKKTTIAHLVFLPIMVFLYKYLLKLGFLDGLHGYILACMLSMYHFARHAKLLMLHYQAKNASIANEAIQKYQVYPRKLPEFI